MDMCYLQYRPSGTINACKYDLDRVNRSKRARLTRAIRSQIDDEACLSSPDKLYPISQRRSVVHVHEELECTS